MRQYRNLVRYVQQDKELKPFHILSAFAEIDYALALNSDVTQFEKILTVLNFIKKPFDETKFEIPDYLIFKEDGKAGLRAFVPKDITKEAAGQFWDSYTLQAGAEAKAIPEIASEIVAIYMQVPYCKAFNVLHGKTFEEQYDDKMVINIQDKIDRMPVTDVMPLAAFFLRRYYKL